MIGGYYMKGRLFKKAAALIVSAVLVTGSVPMQPIADMARDLAITASATTYVSGSHNARCSSCSTGDYFEYNAELFNNTGSNVYIRCINDSSENDDLGNGDSYYATVDYTIVFIRGNTIYTHMGKADRLSGTPGGDTVFAYTGSAHSLISSAGTTR